MAIETPPKGWYTSGEAWGTDIVRDETTYVTGGVSIAIADSASTSDKLYSPWIATSQPSEPVEARLLAAWASVYTDSVTANPNAQIDIEFYNEDKTSLISTVSVATHALISTSGWMRAGGNVVVPTGAFWARLALSRSSSTDANTFLYYDSTKIEKAKPLLRATRSSGGSVSGTATTLGSFSYASTTGGPAAEHNLMALVQGTETWFGTTQGSSTTSGQTFIAHEPGFYRIQAKVYLAEWVSGDVYQARIRLYTPDVITVGHALRETIYGVPVYAGANYTATANNELPVEVDCTRFLGPYFTVGGPIGAWEVQIIRLSGSGTPAINGAETVAVKES